MANKNEFPKVDGDVLWASEVNSLDKKTQQVYTSTGLDYVHGSTETATTEKILEFDPVVFDNMKHSFAFINIAGFCSASYKDTITNSLNAFSTITVEIKEIGQAYNLLLTETTFCSTHINVNNYGHVSSMTAPVNFNFPISLTEGQKDNGFQVKITLRGKTVLGAGSAIAAVYTSFKLTGATLRTSN